MKQKLKRYLKIASLLFIIMLLFESCQKDDDFQNIKSSYNKSKVIAKRVTLNEVKKNKLLKKSLDKIEKQFDYIKKSSLDSKINATDNSFVILTDEIIEISTDTTVAYTFKIETPTSPDSSFENFVITRLHDYDYQFYIFRYIEHDLGDDVEPLFSFSKQRIDENLIALGSFDDYLNNKMFYDKESGCWIDVTQVGSILYVNISGCGDLGIGFPSNFGGGTMGPWTVHPIAIDGVCYATRGYINTDGEPDTQMIPIPCIEDFDPNDFDNGNNSDFPWDGNTDWTDYNTDPLHDGAGTQTNTNDNSNNDDSVSTIGILKQTNAEKVIECVGETNLSPTQITWLNSDDPNIANEVKKMSSMIEKNKCHVMSSIILEYLENTVVDLDDFVENELECYSIQSLLESSDFVDAIDNLNDYIEDNEENEQGYEISRVDDVISSNFVSGNYGNVVLNKGGDIIGGMHIHPAQGDKMFSAEDIFNLYGYYQTVSSNPDVSFHEVFSTLTTENGTYMIKINDFDIFRALINQINPTNFYGMKAFNRKFSYRKNANATQFERKFLNSINKLMEKYDFQKSPIKLFKLNNISNTFEKIILDSSGDPLPVSCE